MPGLEDFVLAFLFQRGVRAVGFDFTQGLFQACKLIAVAMSLGLFDLFADSLALGGATGEAWFVFSSLQWR
ncbi:hypothetical protein D3C76_825650 [compost metagenome]